MTKIVRDKIGPLTYTTFDNDLNVTSPYSINIMLDGAAFDACIADDGGSYTDETTEAGDLTTGDMTLAPAGPVAEDAYYFGASTRFNEMAIEVSTSAGVSVWTNVMEYWNGTTWTTLTVTDNSSSYENAAGIYHIYWTMPTDWVSTTVNSQGDYFYIRNRISAFTSNTNPPLARQARYYRDKSDWKISSLELSFDAASTCEVKVYRHSVNGRNYDILLDTTTLAANTSYILTDSPNFKFRDHVAITLTEAGGQHVYGTLMIEELAPGDY